MSAAPARTTSAGGAIRAEHLAARTAGIEPIGLGQRGTSRLAWTEQDAAAGAWFAEQAARGGLAFERDPAGNLWAMPPGDGPCFAVGSHLDTVRCGGRYDGALGVAAAFEIAARSARPLAVISFADEEGARFNTPTFGSKALAGTLDVDGVLERTDDDGISLAQAMAGAGVDPSGLSDAPAWMERLTGFAELHIDQSRDVAASGVPAGIVSGLASRMRLRATLSGQADHAGATKRDERRDALAAAARLIVAAQDAADAPGLVATASRILVEPNALTTIPSHVRLWLDARAPAGNLVTRWRERLARDAAAIAQAADVELELRVESESAGTVFDAGLRGALRDATAALGAPAGEFLCFAGHDAGVVALRRPAAMVLVRNPTGISHAPEEDVSLDDAAFAASALLAALDARG